MNVRAFIGCLLILALALGGGCSDGPTVVSNRNYSASIDSSFVVGAGSFLEIDNFAGNINISTGAAGTAQVTATTWAAEQADLAAIDVELTKLQNGVRIATDNPQGLKQVSVDVDVTVPADAIPLVTVVAGSITYEGDGRGLSSYGTSAGHITLRLPANVSVSLLLTAASGTIQVDFPLTGVVSDHRVEAVIGTGSDGSITAGVAAGKIIVTSQ